MKTIEELRNAADRLGRGYSMGNDAETIDEAIGELERLRTRTAAEHDAQCNHFIEAVGLVARTAELEAALRDVIRAASVYSPNLDTVFERARALLEAP